MSARGDVVVGCIARLTWPDLAPWVNSLQRSGFTGRLVVIHVGAEPETLAALAQRGVELIDAAPLHPGAHPRLAAKPEPAMISVDRFFYLWHFLPRIRGEGARWVIATDARDVVFQSNPSHWLSRHMQGELFLASSESLRFGDEEWNARTLRDGFGAAVFESMKDRPVYNAGTVAGAPELVGSLALETYLLATGAGIDYSDQPALNLLLASKGHRELTRFAEQDEGWACQAGTTADPRVIEAYRPKLLGAEPLFDGESVRTSRGEPFALVHQYDRVPAWREAMRRKFG